MWSTFGLHDLSTVAAASAAGLVAVGIGDHLSLQVRRARSRACVFVIDAVLLTVAIVATRIVVPRLRRAIAVASARERQRVAIYGAGSHGQMLVREMLANTSWNCHPVAFVDDDPAKHSIRMVGVPVRGAVEDLERVIREHDD